jgi:hypothetical protein
MRPHRRGCPPPHVLPQTLHDGTKDALCVPKPQFDVALMSRRSFKAMKVWPVAFPCFPARSG